MVYHIAIVLWQLIESRYYDLLNGVIFNALG